LSEPQQEIAVLIGQPVAGNPTQYMLEKAFAQAGLDWRYLTLEVPPDRLEDAVRGFRVFGFRGANIAPPHKQAILSLVDELSDSARRSDSVNCLHQTADRLRGENTLGIGLLRALRESLDPAGKQFVLLGAGATARACAVELAQAKPAKITLVNRTAERARSIAEQLQHEFQIDAESVEWSGEFVVPIEADALIQATPLGSQDLPDRVPVDLSQSRTDLLVADWVFNPVDTPLLQEAKASGRRTLDGLQLLVQQGAIAFQIWTGVQPDTVLMREALEEFLSV
jgi:shikimate dehydrogenase